MTPASNFLDEIFAAKQRRVAAQLSSTSLESVRKDALSVRCESEPHAFRRALEDSGSQPRVIAEFKRASPSKGVIRADLSPAEAARAYCAGGAAAVSVLTEEDYFQGSLEDLRAVAAAVELPVLRKDFVFCEFQIYEAAAAGADAVLLITAALDDETLARLRRVAEEELGLDALVEVHTGEEMRRAGACGASVVGVNNRDLRAFRVSLDVSNELAALAPPRALLVSESGIKTGADILRLCSLGYRAFLIGEALMRADDPEALLRDLVSRA